MKRLAIGLLALALAGSSAGAAALVTDGFETYNPGALDKDLAGGPNAAPNGSGNPWFGPLPPNLFVVGAENGVTPHSGTQMIRGSGSPSDFDQLWYNLAYRVGNGQPLTGNLAYSFWFNDVAGAANGANLRDFAAIGFYNTAPGNTDYPGAGSLNSSTTVERLSLGASSDQNGGYDPTKYQVRVVGASGGYDGATGWFNTPVTRTIGWHQALITLSPAAADGSNTVSFYIDNLVIPAFTTTTVVNAGYNVLEFNANFGPGTTTGYWDDVNLSTLPVPEPAAVGLLALAGAAACGGRRHRR
jgi:hypothetical protein